MNSTSINENQDAQVILNQIVIEYMREQKRKRRWRWGMCALFFFLILYLAYNLFGFNDEDKSLRIKPHVGLIDLRGTISDTQSANSDNFSKGLDDAYSSSGLKALILRINSPGGSPVQADYMYNTVQYYRKKHPEIKVYAVCVDMCASAAYYVAAAADEIYANPSSIVGSIGVLYSGFGFVDTLQKLGVTRRLQTAGSNKGMLDPFSPVSPQQTHFLQIMLDDIHQVFINKVKEGRGNRLKVDELTFSGLFWTGQQAKERGLIDDFASSDQIATQIVKTEKVIDYTYKLNVLERVAKNIGTAVAEHLPVAMGLQYGINAKY